MKYCRSSDFNLLHQVVSHFGMSCNFLFRVRVSNFFPGIEPCVFVHGLRNLLCVKRCKFCGGKAASGFFSLGCSLFKKLRNLLQKAGYTNTIFTEPPPPPKANCILQCSRGLLCINGHMNKDMPRAISFLVLQQSNCVSRAQTRQKGLANWCNLLFLFSNCHL